VRDFTDKSDLIEADLKTLESGDSGAAILDAVRTRKIAQPATEGRQRLLLLISENRDHGSHLRSSTTWLS